MNSQASGLGFSSRTGQTATFRVTMRTAPPRLMASFSKRVAAGARTAATRAASSACLVRLVRVGPILASGRPARSCGRYDQWHPALPRTSAYPSGLALARPEPSQQSWTMSAVTRLGLCRAGDVDNSSTSSTPFLFQLGSGRPGPRRAGGGRPECARPASPSGPPPRARSSGRPGRSSDGPRDCRCPPEPRAGPSSGFPADGVWRTDTPHGSRSVARCGAARKPPTRLKFPR